MIRTFALNCDFPIHSNWTWKWIEPDNVLLHRKFYPRRNDCRLSSISTCLLRIWSHQQFIIWINWSLSWPMCRFFIISKWNSEHVNRWMMYTVCDNVYSSKFIKEHVFLLLNLILFWRVCFQISLVFCSHTQLNTIRTNLYGTTIS